MENNPFCPVPTFYEPRSGHPSLHRAFTIFLLYLLKHLIDVIEFPLFRRVSTLIIYRYNLRAWFPFTANSTNHDTKNKAIMRLSGRPSHLSLCFGSKLVVVVAEIESKQSD